MDGEEYNKKLQYINERTQGRIQGVAYPAHAPAPLKLEKIRFFGIKS